MIVAIDALVVAKKNIGRTEALIEAMDKIRAYNRLYQMRESAICPLDMRSVKQIQDQQLLWIESSCAEHAIISLATAFETYYKAIVQELLFSFPEFFLKKETKYSKCINILIESEKQNSVEQIETILNLRNRFDYYKFLQEYSIEFLSKSENEFIESIYSKRNLLVHTAGDLHDIAHGMKINEATTNVENLRHDAKVMRTKFRQLIKLIHQRTIDLVNGR